jgi:hypothetical protein
MKTRPEYREATEEGKPEKEMPQLGAANLRIGAFPKQIMIALSKEACLAGGVWVNPSSKASPD